MNAIEMSVDGIAILDAQGVYTYMNTAHARCYGYAPQDLIGREWSMLYHPAQVARFLAEVFPTLDRTNEWTGQSEGRRRDGSLFPQEVSLRKLDDGGLICVVRDITDKIRNDYITRIVKLAVEAASDGIAITDEDNKIIFMNLSFLKIHGYDPHDRERYLGMDWRHFYNDAGRDHINTVVLPTTILKGHWSGTTLVVRPDGSRFYGDASLTKLTDGLILGVMRDITDRRLAEIEREKLRERIFQSEKIEAVGRITTKLLDDFQKMLSIIREMTDGKTMPSVESMRIIRGAADKAQQNVDEIMSLYDQRATRAVTINLYDFISKQQASLSSLFPRSVTFEVDLLRAGGLSSRFDEQQLYQIIRHLCLNAIESIADTSGRVVLAVRPMDPILVALHRDILVDTMPVRVAAASVRTRFTSDTRGYAITGYLLRDRNYAEIVVSDTGSGISREILGHIFDPFFTTKASSKGAGIGLPTVQGYVTGAGGAVIVETLLNAGTNVHIYLPVPEAV